MMASRLNEKYWSSRLGLAMSLYWAIPYEFKRSLFKILLRKNYLRYRRMKTLTTPYYSLQPFLENKCIFIHIPRSAGNSVCRTLFGNRAGGHMSIVKYQLAFNKNEFDNFFKFTFVRNPWDRVVSAFHFLKEGGFNDMDKEWAARNLSEYQTVDGFVKGWLNRKRIGPKFSTKHFFPQYKFVCTKGSVPGVDFIGYFENLKADIVLIQKKIGADIKPLTLVNESRTRDQDYRHYYSDASRKIVAEVYAEDIRIFGYDFDNHAISHQFADRNL